jgi:hypothetical protein
LHAQNLGEIDVSDVTNDLAQLYVESDALSLADLIRRKQVSPIEIVDTAIFLIERLDPKLNAVVIRTFDIARQAAAHQGTGPLRRRTLPAEEHRFDVERHAAYFRVGLP